VEQELKRCLYAFVEVVVSRLFEMGLIFQALVFIFRAVEQNAAANFSDT